MVGSSDLAQGLPFYGGRHRLVTELSAIRAHTPEFRGPMMSQPGLQLWRKSCLMTADHDLSGQKTRFYLSLQVSA
jgi:hypothetical protein